MSRPAMRPGPAESWPGSSPSTPGLWGWPAIAAGIRADAFRLWQIQARANGALIVIPEIADYEVRRELIRAEKHDAVRRLDALRAELHYVPISTDAMRKAAELWADARRRGRPSPDDKALDGDVIVAAQAILFAGRSDRLTIATGNRGHFPPSLDARSWEAITP